MEIARPSGAPGAPATPGRPADAMARGAWHRKASRPVSLWMMGLLVLALVHRWIPQSRWLLVHMFTLGMITNSILVWGQHFTDALLRTASSDADRRRQVLRIRLLNLAIVVTCVGMVASWPWVAVAGAAGVGCSLCWYALDVMSQLDKALPARFTSTVRFYVAAALLLPVGATFGGFMAFSQPEPWQGRLLLAHQIVNVLGFVGLTAVGTLVTLWPTVLRTKMEPDQDVQGRRALWVLSAAMLVAAVGALFGWPAVVAVSLVAYLVGLGIIGRSLLACAIRKPPRDFPGYSIGAALLWLPATVVWLVVAVLRTPGVPPSASEVQALTVPFVAGFLVQLLFGAMSYLMPTVMGGGPRVVRTACAQMNKAGALRVSLYNASLLEFLASDDSWTRVIASLMAFGVLVAFVPLLKSMVKTSVAERRAVASEAQAKADAKASGDPETVEARPVDRAERVRAEQAEQQVQSQLTARRDVVGGLVGVGAALGAMAVGRSITTRGSHDGAAGVAATGHTTEVTVHTSAMRFVPDTVQVPLGDRLRITLVNDDAGGMVHDLYLDNGTTSGRLSPGQKVVMDAGVIGGNVEGWCTIVGHRSMGMVFHVVTEGGVTEGGMNHATQTGGMTSARVVVDLSKAPGKDHVLRDAKLPAAGAKTQKVDLTVTEAILEVAPGRTMKAMTFNGRVMGPPIVAMVGDTIDCHLVNKGSMGHSIDFHAGQVAPDRNMRTIAPGESLDYRFTANHSGIWLYHCSTMPMSSHIAAGMYGAVVVRPKNLAPVQREYVLVQQEMYLGADGAEVDAAKIADERVDLTVWNGHANQYVFAPLEAVVGERVRIWVLAAGPSRGTSFHVVGAQFDTVFKEGAYLLRPGNTEAGGSQALDLSSCQGGFVEMVFSEAGTYTFVNHSFVEMERGARGLIKVRAR